MHRKVNLLTQRVPRELGVDSYKKAYSTVDVIECALVYALPLFYKSPKFFR